MAWCRLQIPHTPPPAPGSLPLPVPAESLALTGDRHHHVTGQPIGGPTILTAWQPRPRGWWANQRTSGRSRRADQPDLREAFRGGNSRRPDSLMGTMLASPPGDTGSIPVAFLMLERFETSGEHPLARSGRICPGASAPGQRGVCSALSFAERSIHLDEGLLFPKFSERF